MPVYEFYCSRCHTIFSFFSKTVNTEKKPLCPRCGKIELERHMSVFATPRNRSEEEDLPLPDLDESKMERAMNVLAAEAAHLDENDPKQAAQLMRKLTDMTGLDLGDGMEEALSRMERGEDPEAIESEMGDLLEGDEPFAFGKKPVKGRKKRLPRVDETLYDL